MPPIQPPKRRAWTILWAVLRQRCPRCLTGRMFRGSFAMNDPCPACGLVFQREEGYFLGAMYVSSVLSMAAATPIYFALAHFFPEGDSILLALSAFALYLPLTPAVFRYSRVGWIYLDRAICSGASSAGSFEKVRLGSGGGDLIPRPPLLQGEGDREARPRG